MREFMAWLQYIMLEGNNHDGMQQSHYRLTSWKRGAIRAHQLKQAS